MIVTSETPEERAEQAFSGWFAPGSDARDRLIAIAAGQIRAARLEALEEAAKIAESIPYVRTLTPNPGAHEAITAAQTEIAAAIRERAKA